MGRYITPAPRVKKQQVFTTSGTFTPSSALLAAGGAVTVRCIGGGGGGNGGNGVNGAGGSSGMDLTRLIPISAAVTITIGAGGTSGQTGGSTTFGTQLTAFGGKPGSAYVGGASVGEGSRRGQDAVTTQTPYVQTWTLRAGAGGGSGGGQGHSSEFQTDQSASNAKENTGGGGGGGSSQNSKGGSGLCIITWDE